MYSSLGSVIVTGAGGMIGRRVVANLADRGRKVLAVDTNTDRIPLRPNIKIIEADLLAEGAIKRIIDISLNEEASVPAILHLAGMSIAADASAHPEEAIRVNVILTERLLELIQAHNISGLFMLASTGAIYGDSGNRSAREEDLPAPSSVYAASKVAAEAFCQAVSKEHGLTCEIVRISNVYGPESRDNTVIGRLLGQAKRGEPLTAATPNPVRDFIHADDVAEGIVRLLETAGVPGYRITNLSTEVGTQIGKVAEIVTSIVGGSAPTWTEPRRGVDDVLILANQRLFNRTGWRPHYTVDSGLRAILTGG